MNHEGIETSNGKLSFKFPICIFIQIIYLIKRGEIKSYFKENYSKRHFLRISIYYHGIEALFSVIIVPCMGR